MGIFFYKDVNKAPEFVLSDGCPPQAGTFVLFRFTDEEVVHRYRVLSCDLKIEKSDHTTDPKSAIGCYVVVIEEV